MIVKFNINGFTTDITTNSSSEIFTGIRHNLDAVTEIVEGIFDWYNNGDEDELEWGKHHKATMDTCLTISVIDNAGIKELAEWRANTPDWPRTGEHVTTIVNGERQHEYVKFDNADEIEAEYDKAYELAVNEYVKRVEPSLEGTIVIESISDNTIPYDIIEKIEDTFICQRTHLG